MNKTSLLILTFLALYLTPEFDFQSKETNLCANLKPLVPKSSLVLRIINNSQSLHFNQCLKDVLEKSDVIVVADEKIEKRLLHEMMKQSKLPTKTESLIPIGEMLVPDHLLVIKNNNPTLFGKGLDIGLFEIKSGKVLYKDVFRFGFYELYKKEVNSFLFYTALFILYFLIFRFLNVPLIKAKKKRVLRINSHREFEKAKTLLKSGNIHDGAEAMMVVASDQIDGGASNSAKEQLKQIKSRIETEK